MADEKANKCIGETSFMIHSFMCEGGLRGNGLILYAFIYSFTKGAESLFYGTYEYAAKSVGMSVRTVQRTAQELLSRGLIEVATVGEHTGLRTVDRALTPEKAKVKLPHIKSAGERLSKSRRARRLAFDKPQLLDGGADAALTAGVEQEALGSSYSRPAKEMAENTEKSPNLPGGISRAEGDCERIMEKLRGFYKDYEVELFTVDEGGRVTCSREDFYDFLFDKPLPSGIDFNPYIADDCERRLFLSFSRGEKKYFTYAFGDKGYVSMTAAQYEKLLTLVSEESLHGYICRLERIISDGALHKSPYVHSNYKTLKKWIEADLGT